MGYFLKFKLKNKISAENIEKTNRKELKKKQKKSTYDFKGNSRLKSTLLYPKIENKIQIQSQIKNNY